ncbi:hypothetical protein P4H42_13770 [Paenibacillus macerans]|uniref:hypothetical protein n=1 Tax=Paenibacillus macerans TaxID=44252 RepID=UPI002DB5A68A|nr:hypothetical protein [Paenibacillus macerans]MEC0330683.1 hypothetical protein [Paenibacillus macerans]
MELKSALIAVMGISLIGFGLLYAAGRLIGSREEALGFEEGAAERAGRGARDSLNRAFSAFALRSYALWMKLAPLRHYALKIRKRLAPVHRFDEFELRRETMRFAYFSAGAYVAVVGVLAALNPNWIFVLSLLIAGAVIQGVLLDGYVNRQETRLLEQMLDFFAAVRHAYHRHGMVADAIEEAGENTGREIGIHAHMIGEALTDASPDEALEKYYETAPSRFLKAFAGISRLVLEYGDRKRAQGSLYLRGITSLTGEIQLELIRKNRLDYLLKGLHVIALTPVFFTKPVELWARSHFPLMDQFYLSKAGMVIKIGLFLIILLSYLLLQKLKSEEETAYRAGQAKVPWEARLLKVRGLGTLGRWFVPRPATKAYHKLARLLKDTNHTLPVELFQIRRVALFVSGLLVTLVAVFTLHHLSRQYILLEPPAGAVFFGSLTKEETTEARVQAELDARVMKQLGMAGDAKVDEVAESAASLMSSWRTAPTREDISAAARRIQGKLQRWNDEYLKWWELLLALLAGGAGYYFPLWSLMFQRSMRLMDMRHEVYQFQTMIAILRELERISVEEILEWLASYAVIFRTPLQKCLLDYGHGAEAALEELKREVVLDEFRRLADKLLLASEKITIADAFDDLDSEMSYHFEQRRLDYEKSIDVKAGFGRMIGFAPMYSLVFAYLVFPLIWMSFQQMGLYFEQIQKL